jgi:hypothetical protein
MRGRPGRSSRRPRATAARYWLAVAQLGAGWGSGPVLAAEAASQACALYRGLGDPLGLYRSLNVLIGLSVRIGATQELPALLQEMAQVESPAWAPLAHKLLRWTLASEHKRHGRIAEYRDAFRDEVALLTALGDTRNAGLAAHAQATAELALGNVDAAIEVMETVVAQARAHGLLRQSWPQLAMLMLALIEKGDLARAAPTVREALTLMRAEGTVWWAADHLALVPALRGDLATAARLHGWSDARLAARGEAERGPAMRGAYERLRATLASAFAPPALELLKAEGTQWSDDDVIASVLGERLSV